MELWRKINKLHHLILYLNGGMSLNDVMIREPDFVAVDLYYNCKVPK